VHIKTQNLDQYAVRTVDMRVDYGDFVAVNELCLNVPKGEIYGLIGPNGAGKTSSFKVLATLMEPTYGDVFIGGVDISLHPEEARKHLGYMPDLAPIATDLKVWEFLDLFATAHGLNSKTGKLRVEECLDKVALDDKRNEYCKSLSRGMMQRLVLAKTLLHRPSLFLLDEPASGMDPESRKALRYTVRQLANEGAAVLLSSHILTELEDMCTMVGMMSKGNLVESGKISDVITRRSNEEKSLIIESLDGLTPIADFISSNKLVGDFLVNEDELVFSFNGNDEEQVQLLNDIVIEGFRIKSLREQKKNIEQILLEMNTAPNSEEPS
jgi:ABC-2 type transport system ATP-binding protein